MTDQTDAAARLMARCQDGLVAYALFRCNAFRGLPGNPRRAEHHRVGSGIGVCWDAGGRRRRAVLGLRADELEALDEYLQEHLSADDLLCVTMLPHQNRERTDLRLLRHGCSPVSYTIEVFAGAPEGEASESAPLVDTDSQELFWDLLGEGFEIPLERRESARREYEIEFRDGVCDRFVGFDQGTPAGAATLHVFDGVGYLTYAAVIPELRNLGVHRALTQSRIARAQARNCEVLMAFAHSGYWSGKTFMRAGLSRLPSFYEWTNHP